MVRLVSLLKFVVYALPIVALGSFVSETAFAVQQDSAAPTVESFDFKGYPKPGTTQTYKGKLLVGSTHPAANNKIFFRHAKKAVDLAEKLPPALRKGTKLVSVIIYNPDLNNKVATGVSKGVRTQSNDGLAGTYQLGPKMTQMSPLVVTRDLTFSPPIDVAYALLDSSLSARLQSNMIFLAKKMKMYDSTSTEFSRLNKKFAIMKGLVTKSDAALVEKYKCKPLEARYAAMKAWKVSLLDITRLKRELSEHKCKF